MQAREALVKQFTPSNTKPNSKSIQSLKQSFKALEQEVDKNCGVRWTRNFYSQFNKVADEDDSIPACLQATLETQSTKLDALVSQLLDHPIPTNYYEADYEPGKSYVDLNNVFANPVTHASQSSFFPAIRGQQLLLLFGLRKSQLGQPQAVLDAFAAAWKLNQSLLGSPLLISNLVHLIAFRHQAAILRNVNELPANWPQRFPKLDRRTPLFKSLEVDIFTGAEIIRTYPAKKTKLLAEPRRRLQPSTLFQLLQSFQQPYFTLSAVDLWQKKQQINAAMLHSKDLCALDPEDSTLNLEASLGRWNILGHSLSGLNLLTIWRKLGRGLLDWELTQKVLEVKGKVARTGKFPKSIPGIMIASACPSQKWRLMGRQRRSTLTILLSGSDLPTKVSPLPCPTLFASLKSWEKVSLQHLDKLQLTMKTRT